MILVRSMMVIQLRLAGLERNFMGPATTSPEKSSAVADAVGKTLQTGD